MEQRLFTTRDFVASGRSRNELYWLLKKKRIVSIERGVFAGAEIVLTPLDYAVARAMAGGGPATGLVGAALYGLDAVDPAKLEVPGRRRAVAFGGDPQTISGILVAHPLQIIVELAAILDDLRWEQALESGLRKDLFSVDDLIRLLPELSGSRTHGTPRIRRVLRLRPEGAPPTESLLETLMVQLARVTPGVPEPERQVEVFNRHQSFVARVDLAWSDVGAFNELDGMGHEGQPVYDASRETAVVRATGWLCGRFTWREVRHNPKPTSRALAELIDQARRRPLRPSA